MDDNAPSRQLIQQLADSRGNLTLTGHYDGPFQVLPELSRADAPWLQSGRRLGTYLDHGPMANQGDRHSGVGQRTTDDEVVIPVHQDPYRVVPHSSASRLHPN
jgi:hypothetical protein